VPSIYRDARRESRVPLELRVYLLAGTRGCEVESTFTEDVSGGGARVMTIRRWRPDDRLTFVSGTGEFRSTARVTYCQALPGEGFAIGVEFLEPHGRWFVQSGTSSTLG
jgi:hypothetical protein